MLLREVWRGSQQSDNLSSLHALPIEAVWCDGQTSAGDDIPHISSFRATPAVALTQLNNNLFLDIEHMMMTLLENILLVKDFKTATTASASFVRVKS